MTCIAMVTILVAYWTVGLQTCQELGFLTDQNQIQISNSLKEYSMFRDTFIGIL